jgi:hypothetical protein
VDRGTEAFFLANFADDATQFVILLFNIMAPKAGRSVAQMRGIAVGKKRAGFDFVVAAPYFGPFWEA